MYYNTNKEAGETLKASRKKAATQEERILEFFKRHSRSELCPFEVAHILFPGTPITSIRRAMTNLTKKGYLEKLDKFKPGAYGKQNHVWRLTRRN